jgi:Arc/MetJ family transcription regulator
MRTNIEIDDGLMRDALAATGARTKREVVEEGLRALIRIRSQRKILELRGIGWEGDLDVMRTDIDE